MKVVFICGAYRSKTFFGRILNIYRARKAAIKYWQKGYAVICPHSNSSLFDKKAPDKSFLEGYLELVRRSDILAMLSNWSQSPGSQEEHALALKLNKEIIIHV